MSLGLAVMAIGPMAAPVAAGGSETVQFPSTQCPDNGADALQACIDSVASGSTVILTAEINEGETALINKSLTLRAVDRSLQPVLDGVVVQLDSGSPPTVDVTVQDIRIPYVVRVNLSQGSGHHVRLLRLEVGKGASNTRGIEIATSVPASVSVENSYVRGDDEQGDALGMFAEDPDGAVTFRAIGNRVNQHGNPDSGAGINVTMQGQGSVRADIMNNSVWDVARCNCGAAAGIAVLPYGAIVADVNIVGNTIERSRTNAIQQRNALTDGGHLSLDVFGNIFSHIQNGTMNLDRGASGSLAFRSDYNDYYATGGTSLGGLPKGSHNLAKDPRFVDRASGNLRLRSDSPLIDKGQICSPGGVVITDAAGNTRLRGTSVDMGAYERGAGAVTGKAFVGNGGGNTLTGTPGADILCGFGGTDVLTGKGGADYLSGGPGKDRLCAKDGVHGNDRLDGGPASDAFRADSGDPRTSVERSATC